MILGVFTVQFASYCLSRANIEIDTVNPTFNEKFGLPL